MSRLLLLAFVVLAAACLPGQGIGQTCLVSCPGEWGQTGHTVGSETDWLIGADRLGFNLYTPWDPPEWAPLDGYICVCEEECPEFPWDNPVAPGNFRWRGSVLSYPGDPRMRACVDLDCDCTVGMSDFVIFAMGWEDPPPPPTYSQYIKYTTCEPVPPGEPNLSDFVIFAKHFGHGCNAGDCDPPPPAQ